MSMNLREGEEVRPIPGLDGQYSVTSLGRVFSHNYRHTRRTAELAQAIHPEGYRRVKLHAMNRTSPTPVHRIVAMAFHPNPDDLPQVNHIDGNKGNNRAENLEWVDNSGNQRHAFRMGLQTRPVGSEHPMATISESTAAAIKTDLLTPKYKGQLDDIARKYGIKKCVVFDIKRGRSWRHVNAA